MSLIYSQMFGGKVRNWSFKFTAHNNGCSSRRQSSKVETQTIVVRVYMHEFVLLTLCRQQIYDHKIPWTQKNCCHFIHLLKTRKHKKKLQKEKKTILMQQKMWKNGHKFFLFSWKRFKSEEWREITRRNSADRQQLLARA